MCHLRYFPEMASLCQLGDFRCKRGNVQSQILDFFNALYAFMIFFKSSKILKQLLRRRLRRCVPKIQKPFNRTPPPLSLTSIVPPRGGGPPIISSAWTFKRNRWGFGVYLFKRPFHKISKSTFSNLKSETKVKSRSMPFCNKTKRLKDNQAQYLLCLENIF